MTWLDELVERTRRNEGDYDDEYRFYSARGDYRRECEVKATHLDYVREAAHQRLYRDLPL